MSRGGIRAGTVTQVVPDVTKWRSVLFCPGNRPNMIKKAGRAGADVVVLDLEDGVPYEHKSSARRLVYSASRELLAEVPDIRLFVRVNSVGSNWFEGDVAGAVAEGACGIALPKLETRADLDCAASLLDAAGLEQAMILGGLETAAGVEGAGHLGHERLAGLYWGAEDFVADVGGQRTPGGKEVAYARARVAMAARICQVPAVDQAVIDVRNLERFGAEAQEARELGYVGKLCLHPAQVPGAHAAFTPSAAEIEHAKRIRQAARQAVLGQSGVALLDGVMIDQPVLRQAENLLARAGVDTEEM